MKHKIELKIPDEQNVYFIGDIHGNYDLYIRTLKEFGITDDDVVISVGDVIDRGNKSAALAFEFLFKDNRYMVMGNHEAMMVDSETRRDWYQVWQSNGGDVFLNEVGQTGIDFFRPYFNQLPLFIELTHRGKKLGVVHGGLPLTYPTWKDALDKTNSLQYNDIEPLIWDRNTFDWCRKNNAPMAPRVPDIDYIFSGHTAVTDPLIYGNRVWIDSQFLTGDLTIAYMDGNFLRTLRRERDEYSFMRGK